jgi:hypothetical protein
MVAWLVGWCSFPVKELWALKIIFTNVSVVMIIAMVMLLRDIGPYVILMTLCAFITSGFSAILDGKFTSTVRNNLTT